MLGRSFQVECASSFLRASSEAFGLGYNTVLLSKGLSEHADENGLTQEPSACSVSCQRAIWPLAVPKGAEQARVNHPCVCVSFCPCLLAKRPGRLQRDLVHGGNQRLLCSERERNLCEPR